MTKKATSPQKAQGRLEVKELSASLQGALRVARAVYVSRNAKDCMESTGVTLLRQNTACFRGFVPFATTAIQSSNEICHEG
jgi:hypothetical protein